MANILIGYSRDEETRAAFEREGHNAWTCDVLPANHAKHFQRDVWEVLRAYKWDAAVLHPMCTYLTTSAAWAFKDPDYNRYPSIGYHQKVAPGTLLGAERRAARAEAIENFRALLALPFPVGIENPAGSFLNTMLRRPDQVIQPYEYGDDASKATGIWLNGLPRLKWDIDDYVPPRLICGYCSRVFEYGQHKCPHCHSEKYLPRWANQTDSGQNRLSPADDRWLVRSKTYPGIARALGSQWGRYLAS